MAATPSKEANRGKEKHHKQDSAAKVAKKRPKKPETTEKLRAAKANYEKLSKDIDEKKKRLEQAKNSPESKAECDKLQSELDKDGDTLMAYGNEVKKLEDEENDHNMNASEEEQEDVPSEPASQPRLPQHSMTPALTSTSSDSSTRESPIVIDEDDDQTDEEDIFTIKQYQAQTGQAAHAEPIAWKRAGLGKHYVMRYGPLNAATYKLQPGDDIDVEFDDDTLPDISDPDKRYGEMKANRKWKYFYRHIVAIQEVVWSFREDNHEEGYDPLNLMDPSMKTEDRRYPSTHVKIKWNIEGEIRTSWEIRTTIHRLWKSKTKGNKVIYDAARTQERRHWEWKNGQRAGNDKSPTPDNLAVPRRLDSEASGSSERGRDSSSPAASDNARVTDNASRATTDTGSASTEVTQATTKDNSVTANAEELEKLRDEFFLLYGKLDKRQFSDKNAKEQAKAVEAFGYFVKERQAEK